jgi:hypothetical protein
VAAVKQFEYYIIIPMVALLVICVFIAFGFVVSGLWNILLVPLFAFPTINMWQGLGIFVLFRLLFGIPFISPHSKK